MERGYLSSTRNNKLSPGIVTVLFFLVCALNLAVISPIANSKENNSGSEHHSTETTGKSASSSTANSSAATSKNAAGRQSESEGDVSAAKSKGPDGTETAEQAFQAYRAAQLESIVRSAHSSQNSFGVKLARAVEPIFREGYSLPLRLDKSETVNGATVLHYTAADKKLSCGLNVTMRKVDDKWTVEDQNLNGTYFSELGSRAVSNIVSAVPGEMSIIGLGLFLAGLSILALNIGSIWLIVVAFQTSIVWGFCTLLLPFASLVFAVMHWDRAKKPMIVMITSAIGLGISVGIEAAMIASAADLNSGILNVKNTTKVESTAK